jgi:hypothetical protein
MRTKYGFSNCAALQRYVYKQHFHLLKGTTYLHSMVTVADCGKDIVKSSPTNGQLMSTNLTSVKSVLYMEDA